MPPAADPLSPSNRPLNYAPAPPRTRKWLFRSTLLAILLVLTGVAWRWGPAARRQAQLLYWQRKCRTYTAPRDEVVYEEDPAAAARLLVNNAAHYAPYPLKRTPAPGAPAPANAAARLPACWSRFD